MVGLGMGLGLCLGGFGWLAWSRVQGEGGGWGAVREHGHAPQFFKPQQHDPPRRTTPCQPDNQTQTRPQPQPNASRSPVQPLTFRPQCATCPWWISFSYHNNTTPHDEPHHASQTTTPKHNANQNQTFPQPNPQLLNHNVRHAHGRSEFQTTTTRPPTTNDTMPASPNTTPTKTKPFPSPIPQLLNHNVRHAHGRSVSQTTTR